MGTLTFAAYVGLIDRLIKERLRNVALERPDPRKALWSAHGATVELTDEGAERWMRYRSAGPACPATFDVRHTEDAARVAAANAITHLIE